MPVVVNDRDATRRRVDVRNVLEPAIDAQVIQRENNLENAMLNGELTVSNGGLPLRLSRPPFFPLPRLRGRVGRGLA